MLSRDINPVDKLLIQADAALRTIFGNPPLSGRPNPAENLAEAELNQLEKKHTAGLMRVNHSGEVSAQGLYQGQALTARLPRVREKMEQAAIEENDHLAWCEQRLKDLGAKKSLLNPVWYTGSFLIGATAGMAPDLEITWPQHYSVMERLLMAPENRHSMAVCWLRMTG